METFHTVEEESKHDEPNLERNLSLLNRQFRLQDLIMDYSKHYHISCFFDLDIINNVIPANSSTHPINREPMRTVCTLYRLMRWKSIKIKIVPAAAPDALGFIFMTYFPGTYEEMINAFWSGVGTPSLNTIDAFVPWNRNCNLIPVNAQEGLEIELPWNLPFDWVPANPIREDFEGIEYQIAWYNQWTVLLRAMVRQMHTNSIVANVKAQVYMQVVGLEFSAPVEVDVKTVTQIRVKGQSGLALDRPIDSLGTAMGVASAGAIVAGQAVSNSLASMVESVGGSVAATAAAAAAAPGVLSKLWATAREANAAHNIVQKVTSQATQQNSITQSTHGDSAVCMDSGGGPTLDMFEDVRSVDPKRYCDDSLTHTVRSLIQTPQIMMAGPLELGNINNIGVVPYYPGNQYCGYLSYFSQFFRRWRGSINFTFYFSCSVLASAKIKIGLLSWGDVQYDSTDDAEQMMGSRPTISVDLRGFSQITVNVPFMSLTPWRYTYPGWDDFEIKPTYIPNSPPKIFWVMDSFVVGQTNISGESVMAAVFMSAGDDFVFDSLQAPRILLPTAIRNTKRKDKKNTVRVKGQSSVSRASTYVQALPGFELPKPVPWTLTVEDMCKRWSSRGKSLAFVDSRTIDYAPGVDMGTFDMLTPLFKYNAGGIRRKNFSPTESGTLLYSLSNIAPESPDLEVDCPSSALVGTNNGVWPILDFTTPWISYFEVDVHPRFGQLYLFGDNVEAIASSSNPATLLDQWVKAAYNFQFALPVHVFRKNIWPWAYTPPPVSSKRSKEKQIQPCLA